MSSLDELILLKSEVKRSIAGCGSRSGAEVAHEQSRTLEGDQGMGSKGKSMKVSQIPRKALAPKYFCLVCGFLLSIFLAFSVLSFVNASRAQAQDELVALQMTGETKAETEAEATRIIQAQVTAMMARQQVIEVIGEKKYAASKNVVESKIVQQAARFIPFVNPGKPTQKPDGSWTLTVEFKISTASLRKMMMDAGLFSDSDAPSSILPMVAFTDRRSGAVVRWWMGSERSEQVQLLNFMNRTFMEKLQAELSAQGFHLVKPLGTQTSPLPVRLRVERPSSAELKTISQYFKSPLILKGDVRLRDLKEAGGAVICTVKLQVVQASSGRAVAEIARVFESEAGDNAIRAKLVTQLPELSKDLSVQVLEAWQRGTLNANAIRLAVRGNLNPKQLNDFKTSLMRSVREVKSVRERLFEAGRVQFDIEYTGDVGVLTDKFRSLQMPNFDTRFADATDKSLALDVKAR